MLRILCVAALACLLTTAAEARQRHHHAAQPACADIFCWFGAQDTTPAAAATRARQPRETGAGAVIGGRPAGCPHAYCGCGASLHLFGRIIPSLNLAANWLRFPKAAPAPKMAAVRQHHVFVLEADLGGGVWEVYDANSGGGRIRLHPRSLAGYQIVNPTGGA